MEIKVFLDKIVDGSIPAILRLHDTRNVDDTDQEDPEDARHIAREEALLMKQGLTRGELDEIEVNVSVLLGEFDRPRTLRLATAILHHLLQTANRTPNVLVVEPSQLNAIAHEALNDTIREKLGLWSPDHDALVAGTIKALTKSMIVVVINNERRIDLVHEGKHYLMNVGLKKPHLIISK